MNLVKIIAELRSEWQLINEAISTLTVLARSQGKGRGRPPAWLRTTEKKRRGRPPGAKNKINQLKPPTAKRVDN